MKCPAGLVQLLKLRELRRNQALSAKQLAMQQQAKFRRLLTYINQHSTYYRALITRLNLDINSCVPEDFPVLTKTDLMANFDQIVTDPRLNKAAITQFLSRSRDPKELFLEQYRIIHTSGSSGEVGLFAYSKQDWARGIMQSTRTRPFPSLFKPCKIVFYGAIDGHYAGVSFLATAYEGINRLFYRPLALDINSPLAEVIDALNEFQPDLICGYNTGVQILAEAQKQGRLRIQPQRIELGGESVTDSDKDYLKQVFGAEVFNVYACTEHMLMATSRAQESRLNLWEDDLIFELEADHCLITNLFNYSLPLIRYRMADLLVPAAQPDGVWPYRQIEGLVGRSEQTPWFLNNQGQLDFISPHSINEIFVPGIQRFQMQCLSHTAFNFRVCLESQLNVEQQRHAVMGLRERLRQLLQHKSMDNLSFSIETLSEIPLDPKTRKFKLILGV